MSGLDGLGWPNPEDEPKTSRERKAAGPSDATACSPSSDTPETDAMASMRRTITEWKEHSEKLERERDEARLLCRWAFPRLRAMCHDFDATGTGWCCAEEMASHPEIFPENANSPDAGATGKDHE